MKKKLTALFLAAVMACSLALPAGAAEKAAGSADERLAAVTLAVKGTLGLDTEEYTDFYGYAEEWALGSVWYLEWHRDGGYLSVSAAEDGKILSYDCYDEGDYAGPGAAFAPAFPEGSRDEARAQAEAFLRKVMGAGESYTIEDRGSDTLSMTSYRFRGDILLNGLPAGLTYSLSVSCERGVVSSFYRDDWLGMVIGDVPGPVPAVTAEEAGNTLRSTLELKLEYVAVDGTAVLRYVPVYGDDFYVDAVTGELVNLSELYRSFSEGGAGSDTGASGGAAEEDSTESTAPVPEPEKPTLSDTELAGVDKLAGVWDKETLDAAARAIAALGLDSYTLSNMTYNVAGEPGEDGVYPVTAYLRYSRQLEGYAWRRFVTLDARTGELLEVSSSAWIRDDETAVERTVSLEQATEAAGDFLTELCPEDHALTALYDSRDALEGSGVSHSLVFAQTANGYFCPSHTISVGVDATDGSISRYYNGVDPALVFDSAEGIIGMEEAIDAWLGTYEAALSYINIPTALDKAGEAYQVLADYGIPYLYELALGYTLEREDYMMGIDAKTGEPVAPDYGAEEAGLAYDDLEGHWAKEKIETLAHYGVGFQGASFRPDDNLTQLDLIALMASTEGYVYIPEEEGAADGLYEYAYRLGLLTREERDDGAVLTRAQAVRLVLHAMGYGPVAQLEGIYQTKFTDDADIPAACYGYVALAQGLGVVGGKDDGSFAPNDTATRAEAAVMLYNLMDR